MNTNYTYSDVLIKPKYSEVISRNDVDLSTKLGNIRLDLPIVTANMKTVTGPSMAIEAANNGAMGILHRFSETSQAIIDFNKTDIELGKQNGENFPYTGVTPKNIGVSIGVEEESKFRFNHLYENGARIFCLDVAHGHHKKVKDMLKWIQNEIFRWDRASRDKITLIAGNIATGDAYYDLTEWGADVIKVGIGPSGICATRVNTGVGVPQMSALEEIHLQKMGMEKRPSIIADGGIKYPGDVAKALKYADAVMLGSYFAGCSETPGNVFRNTDGDFYKVYGGSASGENKGKNSFVEGITTTTKFKGHARYLFKELKEGLQSSCSYVGANNLQEFKNKCEFIKITPNASGEGFHR
jgi:IMP dehydrogenase